MGMSSGSCHKVVKKLKVFPFTIHVMHQLLPPACEKQNHYFDGYWKKWMVTLACQTGLLSNEAWFHLTGYVNSENTHLWPVENPHEAPLHPMKTGVWCGGLLGPP
jgi:hypothetical protein